jgi:uncharacterized protein (DUF1330 family)
VPAYVIANVDVRDPEAYEEYRALVPATIAEHGGRYTARGGATEVAEGDWKPKRLVIVEFPSVENAPPGCARRATSRSRRSATAPPTPSS